MAEKWTQFREKVKAKRTGRFQSGPKVKRTELTVQRLSSDVGRAQKYIKLGPREFVPFVAEDTGHPQELTIENVRTACVKHFSTDAKNKNCDILAGERGPSCKLISQLPDFKVIHVRFVESEVSSRREINTGASTAMGTSHEDSDNDNVLPHIVSVQSTLHAPSAAPFVPRSLSVVEMLKLGKIKGIKPKSSVIQIHTFDMEVRSWSKITTEVEFYEESEAIGSGGFRKAFKATSKHPSFSVKSWVIKRYLPEALEGIAQTGQTVQDHTQKVVQMHHLARHFAARLSQKLTDENELESYGPTLRYSDIFLGVTDLSEYVTIEKFVDGNFLKYINNTGLRSTEESVYTQKAESLSHFSYEKSEHKLLLVDIQGSDYDCYDPEIASSDLFDDNEILYCTGNLSSLAISNFKAEHQCNMYCNILKLPKLQNDDDLA